MDKVVLLVDVQNVYYTTREIHKQNFDYNYFWAKSTANREVIKAIAYTTDRGDEKQKQFQNILRAIGFEVKLKPFIQRSDGSAKGDWDVGITIDAMEYSGEADVVVLASGDGDFALLVEKIKSDREVTVEVYGVEQLTANALIQEATKFIPIKGEFLLSRK
tara:strand:- start:26755 stop:27237 length:483 start_codon:yes stop_codon:yes gene_type:complete